MNNIPLVIASGLYTLVGILGVFYYENKIKRALDWLDELETDHFETFSAYCNMAELARQYKELAEKATDEAELYKEAYDSEHSAIHYELDKNEELEAEINVLRNLLMTGESKDMQYESSGWHLDPWGKETPITNTISIDTNPYNDDISPIYGHTPYTKDWHLKDSQPDLFETMENFE